MEDRFAVCAGRIFAFALVALFLLTTTSVAQPNVQGQWTTLPYAMPINPVHVALLHTGKVLVVSGSGNVAGNRNYQAAIWDPQANTISTQPVAWDMFCNGMVVLPDGRPFIMGGTLQYDPFHGELRTSFFDPATGTFTDAQNMAHGRWYPTATTLGDGRIMVFSGLNETGGTNTSVEFIPWARDGAPRLRPPGHRRSIRACICCPTERSSTRALLRNRALSIPLRRSGATLQPPTTAAHGRTALPYCWR